MASKEERRAAHQEIKRVKEMFVNEAIGRLHEALDRWVDDAVHHGGLEEKRAKKLGRVAAGRFSRGRF